MPAIRVIRTTIGRFRAFLRGFSGHSLLLFHACLVAALLLWVIRGPDLHRARISWRGLVVCASWRQNASAIWPWLHQLPTFPTGSQGRRTRPGFDPARCPQGPVTRRGSGATTREFCQELKPCQMPPFTVGAPEQLIGFGAVLDSHSSSSPGNRMATVPRMMASAIGPVWAK